MRAIFRPIPRTHAWNRQAPHRIKLAYAAANHGATLQELAKLLGITAERAAEIAHVRVFRAKEYC